MIYSPKQERLKARNHWCGNFENCSCPRLVYPADCREPVEINLPSGKVKVLRSFESARTDDGAREEGGDQECRHVRGDAAGLGGRREPGPGEVFSGEGYSGFHQEGVRQEVQPDLALHSRPQLRQLRDARDEALHLLLPGPGGRFALQVGLKRENLLAHRAIMILDVLGSQFLIAHFLL